MQTDAILGFGDQQSLSGTSAANSTNVYDAGSAKKLFEGNGGGVLAIEVTAVGGTSPTFQAQFVGADDAALSTNPVVLADTGASKVLAATDLPVLYRLRPSNQKDAKRYYGVIYTLTGTSPTATANANIVESAQNHMVS